MRTNALRSVIDDAKVARDNLTHGRAFSEMGDEAFQIALSILNGAISSLELLAGFLEKLP